MSFLHAGHLRSGIADMIACQTGCFHAEADVLQHYMLLYIFFYVFFFFLC